MKKRIKLVTAGATMMMLGGTITPGIVSACSNEQNVSVNMVRNERTLTNTQQNDLAQFAKRIGINTDSSDIVITDNQMIDLFKHMGISVPNTKTAIKTGVTKIKSYGNGSWDIYLSATFIKNYYWAAATAASALTVLVLGIGWGLAYTIMGSVAGLVGSNVSSGVVVKVRHYKISTIYKQ